MKHNSLKSTDIADGKSFDLKFNILKYFKFFLAISTFLTIASICLVFFKGFNKSVDFAGGFLLNLSCTKDGKQIETPDICIQTLKTAIQSYEKQPSEIKRLSSYIVMQFNAKDIADINQAEEVKNFLKSVNTEGFKFEIVKSDFIMQKFGSQMLKSGTLAIVFTLLGIFAYLFIRFSLAFAISAALTLLHDTFVVLGFLSISGIEVNLSTIAAILTVIGYSVNDSVIIFDRIRNNKEVFGNKIDFNSLIFLSASQTLSRTVITSLTTLFSVVAIILFAGNAIAAFGYICLFGIILGTYSSIFVSAPLLFWLKKFDKSFS